MYLKGEDCCFKLLLSHSRQLQMHGPSKQLIAFTRSGRLWHIQHWHFLIRQGNEFGSHLEWHCLNWTRQTVTSTLKCFSHLVSYQLPRVCHLRVSKPPCTVSEHWYIFSNLCGKRFFYFIFIFSWTNSLNTVSKFTSYMKVFSTIHAMSCFNLFLNEKSAQRPDLLTLKQWYTSAKKTCCCGHSISVHWFMRTPFSMHGINGIDYKHWLYKYSFYKLKQPYNCTPVDIRFA